MSADIYLQCFGKGKPKSVLQEVFEEIVARNAVTRQFSVTRISYLDASTINIYGGDSNAVEWTNS